MTLPKWMKANQSNPVLAADALRQAADAANDCRKIAANLHAAGRNHHDDPGWQAQVRAAHKLADVAGRYGFDGQDVMDEAARLRGA